MVYFLQNQNVILPKTQIFDRLWGFDSDTTVSVVEVYVSKIRKKLKGTAFAKNLHTLRSVGDNLKDGEKNQEDDDDFEPLDTVKKEFDLALRKFITKISSEDGKDSKAYDREPKVDVTPLKNGKTTATYTHPKDPLLVLPKNIVDYTLRIFNEGDVDRIC